MYVVHGRSVLDSTEEILDPGHSALLIVDMQNDMISREGAYALNGEDVSGGQAIVPRVARLADAARAAGVLVVYAQNTTLPHGRSDSGAWLRFKNHSRPGLSGEYTMDGTWGHEIIAELEPHADDVVIRKHRSDAFVGTDLDMVLRAHGTATVVTAGVVTNGCVHATVRHASFLDYYSVVATDACASGSQRLHDAALELLRSRHDLATVAQICSLWSR